MKKLIAVFCLFAFFFMSLGSCQKKTENKVTNTPRATSVPPEYVGTWYFGDVSATEIYSGGSWSNAVGSAHSYTFHSDGTFEYGYRNYVNSYGCTDVGNVYRKGTFTVDGNHLTLYDNVVKINEQHSCNPSRNYDKDGTLTSGEVLIIQPDVDQYGFAGAYITHPGDRDPSWFQKK